jgi:hypothetical protein
MAAARYSIEDVKRALDKHGPHLLAHPNVLYLGIGEKVAKGTGRKRLAIRVYVSQKKGRGYRNAIPSRLRGVNVDGTPARFFISTDVERKPRRLRALALRGGDQIDGATRGSVGLVFQGTAGGNFILTNAHVVLGLDQSAQGQTVSSGGQAVGQAYRATRLSSAPGQLHSIDAAVVVPSVQVDPFAIDGTPTRVTGFGHLATGMTTPVFYVRGNGARLVFNRPNWVASPRAVELAGHSLLFTNFFELTLAQATNSPVQGDSGSVLLSDPGNGLIVHGLLFAGAGGTIGAMDINTVFLALSSPQVAAAADAENLSPSLAAGG